MDRQFECIGKYMETIGIKLNTTSQDKHVPEIEHYFPGQTCARNRTVYLDNKRKNKGNLSI